MSGEKDLNNLLHFFARLHDIPPFMEVRDDYIIETPIGCFRVAYSPSTHTTALFYARHPDDLAAIDDKNGSGGIRHKDRLILIKMFRVHHGQTARWAWSDPTDSRQQFDLTWLRREIARTIHNMPRDQFREANSHRVAKDFHTSVFVGYRSYPSPTVKGEFSGDVITKTDKNYLLLSAPDDITNDSRALQRLFHKVGREVIKHRIGTGFPLRSFDQVTGQVHTSFKKNTMRDLEQADFANRLRQIEDGLDPVHWKEAPLLPIYRGIKNGTNRTLDQLHRISDLRREGGMEEIVRRMLPLAAHLFLDGGISLLESLLIDSASEVGIKEKLSNVPPEWHKIVDLRAKRLVSIHSNLHRRQIRPVPEYFGDLRWLTPTEHACSFAITSPNHPILSPDPERTFRRWAQSLLYAPYASLFEYRGMNDEVLTPTRVSETRFVSQQNSNGIMIYYANEKMYAYYNRQDYAPTDRKLPSDAASFLKEGQVLELDANDWHAPIRTINFETFQKTMRELTQAPELELPTADEPIEEIINSRPASSAGPQVVAVAAL